MTDQSPPGRTTGFAGAASLIAGLTVLSRIVGFGRIFVFSWAVGLTALGNVYQTVNTLPNIIFEIVAGGALAAVVVPLLSAAISRGDTEQVNRTASALMTWVVAVLGTLSIVAAICAGSIVRMLLGADATSAEVASGTRMLMIFAPQLVLYGVGIVLTGIVQAHHRFAWPALAPLLSSVIVMSAYLLFAFIAGRGANLEGLSRTGELTLSVGTTLGVVVLSLCLLIPLRATGVRLSLSFRFPTGVAQRARALIISGVLAVGGQQMALLVVLILTQRPAPTGSLVAYTLAQTIYLLPWAVLAVPVATSVFPRLSASYENGDHAEFARLLRRATQTVIALSALAAAILIAAAYPVAVFITAAAKGNSDPSFIAAAIAAFGPGLIGYSLFALLTRALYAADATWSTALIALAGWAAVIVADVVLATAWGLADRVAALAAGNSIGMTVSAVGLLWWAWRRLGGEVLHGIGRTIISAISALVTSAAIGWFVAETLNAHTLFSASFATCVVGLTVITVFAAITAAVDRDLARSLLVPIGRITKRFKKASTT